MWHITLVLPFLLSTAAIKVPVKKEDTATEIILVNNANPTATPIYYQSDEGSVDSYLVPPDPNRSDEVLPDDIEAPATILLPPSPDQQTNFYYVPAEGGSQSDWYPIEQAEALPQSQTDNIPIYISGISSNPPKAEENLRAGKKLEERTVNHVPSRELEPPFENAPADYAVPIPSGEFQLPGEFIERQFRAPINYKLPQRKKNPLATKIQLPINFPVPTLALDLTPPKPVPTKYKNPTNLYPKKYVGGFKPIPIPISQFAEDSALEVPVAKPVKPFTPLAASESEYFIPADEKKIYNYQQLEQKRREKGETQPLAPLIVEESYAVPTSEPQSSESSQAYPERNAPAPLKQEAAASDALASPAPDDRTEFRMHGMKGPHSYQFGYDTGKGKNRQFRYEERDNDGHVRGHYGYMDKHGKLRVVNYDAHPELGFHAEAPVVNE